MPLEQYYILHISYCCMEFNAQITKVFNWKCTCISSIIYTVGRIIFEDKKFRGFRGYFVNLENKYPRNFLYIHLDSSFNTWWGIRTRSIPRHMSTDSLA